VIIDYRSNARTLSFHSEDVELQIEDRHGPCLQPPQPRDLMKPWDCMEYYLLYSVCAEVFYEVDI
jgi:hypothetical protein